MLTAIEQRMKSTTKFLHPFSYLVLLDRAKAQEQTASSRGSGVKEGHRHRQYSLFRGRLRSHGVVNRTRKPDDQIHPGVGIRDLEIVTKLLFQGGEHGRLSLCIEGSHTTKMASEVAFHNEFVHCSLS